MHALKEYNVKNLIVAGGVSANSLLRTRLTDLCQQENINLTIPALSYCTDNATMIAAAGYFAYKAGKKSDYNLKAQAATPLQ